MLLTLLWTSMRKFGTLVDHSAYHSDDALRIRDPKLW